jgi:hypothetical protein
MLERKGAECGYDALSILAVIVLYKMRPSESVAFRTLQTRRARSRSATFSGENVAWEKRIDI